MGIDERLIFQGLIWPNVEIAGREPVSYDDLDNAPRSMARFHVPIGKPPRPVFYDAPVQWWRNFAEHVTFADDLSIRAWARRHGDPFAEGPDFRPTDTKHWPRLAAVLNVAAELWSDPADDENKISRLSFDTRAAATALTALLDQAGPVDWTPKVNEANGTLEIWPTVRTVERFMLLSATFDIHNKTMTKRCGWCKDWFSPARVDALFCSNTCRQASHQEVKVTGVEGIASVTIIATREPQISKKKQISKK